MTKKAKIGGTVQISGRRYAVQSGPTKRGNVYELLILPRDGMPMIAEAPLWQNGCGPWKIRGEYQPQDSNISQEGS